jgi:hypothetical protein
VRELVRRWGADIYAIEVWNEPNSQFFLSDLDNCDPAEPAVLLGRHALQTRAVAYVPMVKAVYQGVKSSTHPAILVVADGSAFSDTRFLQMLYDHGMKGSYDAISIHPYHLWLRFETPPLTCADRGNLRVVFSTQDPSRAFADPEFSFTDGVKAIHALMVANGDGAPLWFTEFGWPSCVAAPALLQPVVGQDSAPEVGHAGYNYAAACAGLTNQANWLGEAYRIAAGWSFVKVAAMYTSRDGDDNPSSLDTFGLLHETAHPKPAYASVRNTWACLASATC